MKFKVGDRVKIKAIPKTGRAIDNLLYMKKLEFDQKYYVQSFCTCDCCDDDREVFLNIGGYYCNESDLELISRKECKTELDWLNNVRDNFKYG